MTHTASPRRPRPDLGVPGLLVLLGVIPALGGAMRLASYAPGASLLPDDARFDGARGLLVVHIVCALVFALVGAFQFSRGLRGGPRSTHRALGRVTSVAGLVSSVAGLAGLFTFGPHPQGSPFLSIIRVAAGVATVVCLLLGLAAAHRRDFSTHGRWMMRGYALGAAAGGSQAVFLLPLTILQGPTTEGFALGMTLGWVVNVATVEWLLRRPPTVGNTGDAPFTSPAGA